MDQNKLSSSIIDLNNPAYYHYSLCYIEVPIFPHPDAPILVSANLLENHINKLVEIYGPMSISSKHWIQYFQHSKNPAIQALPPYALKRYRTFNDNKDMMRLLNMPQINKVCVEVKELIEPSSKHDDYIIKIDLNNIYLFASNVPEDERYLYISEKEAIVVEAWLSNILASAEIDETKLYHEIMINPDDRLYFELQHKLTDVITNQLLLNEAHQSGFFHLDLLAIEKNIIDNIQDEPEEKDLIDDFLDTSDINLEKIIQNIVKEEQLFIDTKKPSVLKNLADHSMTSYMHPMMPMFDDAYQRIEKIIVDEYGSNTTGHITHLIASELLKTMSEYDIFVQKNDENS